MAFKLDTRDPKHIYDDVNPNWPQQSQSYRAVFQSDRTKLDQAIPPGPEPVRAKWPALRHLRLSTLIDLNAPALVRWSDATGEDSKR